MRTNILELSELRDKNQGLFNGAIRETRPKNMRGEVKTLSDREHKVMREEAADDRQLS
jgi:hypothetical protein